MPLPKQHLSDRILPLAFFNLFPLPPTDQQTMPTLIIHVDKITPNAGYKQKGTQTEPYVQLKLRKPHSK